MRTVENGSGTSGMADEGLGPYIVVLQRRRRILFGLPMAVGLVTGIFLFFSPRQYEAIASFIEQQPSSSVGNKLGSIAGLAGALTGGGVGNLMGSTLSPDFYTEVLQSNELLHDVAVTQYHSSRPGGFSGDLIQYLEIKKKDRHEAELAALKPLKKRLTEVTVDMKSSVVTVTVTTKDPDLSLGIANRMLELVNMFDTRRLQQQAGTEKEFADQQSKNAWADLQRAEDALASFDEQNRSVLASPRLQTQRQQLMRHIEIAEQVFLTLTEEFQQSRLDAVRNTPLIAVIDHPDGLVQPVQKMIPAKSLLAAVATFLVCALTILVIDRDKIGKSDDDAGVSERRAAASARSVAAD
jgi:uncharacterized protein involved in exopolysaccharide biosynthesis